MINRASTLAVLSLFGAVVMRAQPAQSGKPATSAETLVQLIDRIAKLPDLDPVKVESVLGMKAELAETVEDFRRDRLVGKHPLIRNGECRWNHKKRQGLVYFEIDRQKNITRGELFPLLAHYGSPRMVPPSPHAPPDVAATGFVFKTPTGEMWLAFPGFPPPESARLRSVMIDQLR